MSSEITVFTHHANNDYSNSMVLGDWCINGCQMFHKDVANGVFERFDVPVEFRNEITNAFGDFEIPTDIVWMTTPDERTYQLRLLMLNGMFFSESEITSLNLNISVHYLYKLVISSLLKHSTKQHIEEYLLNFQSGVLSDIFDNIEDHLIIEHYDVVGKYATNLSPFVMWHTMEKNYDSFTYALNNNIISEVVHNYNTDDLKKYTLDSQFKDSRLNHCIGELLNRGVSASEFIDAGLSKDLLCQWSDRHLLCYFYPSMVGCYVWDMDDVLRISTLGKNIEIAREIVKTFKHDVKPNCQCNIKCQQFFTIMYGDEFSMHLNSLKETN